MKNTTPVVIELPPNFDRDDTKAFLIENMQALRPALNLDVQNPRADVYAIEIESVEWHGDELHVDYCYRWHVYNGCDNMDEKDDEWEAICGVQQGNCLVFDRYVPPERLSPNEEL